MDEIGKLMFEFECGDCKPGSSVRRFDINDVDERKRLRDWLNIHSANGGKYQYVWNRQPVVQKKIDALIDDGWDERKRPGHYGRISLFKHGIMLREEQL